MAPSTEEADAHLALMNQLDINCLEKPFRNPNWKPNQRRNKNIKNILGDAVRKEASLAATHESTGTNTPNPDESMDGNMSMGTSKSRASQLNLNQASKYLSGLVSDKTTRSNGSHTAPSLTYSSIESAPSLAHSKHYCDITGLPAPYTDPKTRLRYHNSEVFGIIRTLGPGVAEQYLEARGAHTILK
ncbi:putative chromatin-remodeling complex subunit ies6 [Erysiphe neolycopersici]|uniref:Putative chromatin-remodeling complex subunit ies6 n=1 Tax=Erysiphe neolycopersici TaxID=212602 RepID=A0A420HYW9_9PEZI|nr:putative chromatin-remodeling complex subunit ies6 [Erysiphe neolycopersici]